MGGNRTAGLSAMRARQVLVLIMDGLGLDMGEASVVSIADLMHRWQSICW